MPKLVDRLAEIDEEIRRLHAHAHAKETGDLEALLDLAQIDALLEKRHKLRPAEKSPA